MKFYLLTFFTALLCLSGCKDIADLEDVEIQSTEAEFAIPLFKADFTLQKLLDNFGELALITVEPNGCIRLTYEGEVLREGAEIITEAINDVLPLGLPIPLTENETVLPFSIPAEYEFDFIRLKAGGLVYGFELPEEDTIDLVMTFPNFLTDGEPIVFNIQANGGAPFYTNAFNPFDLEGAVIAPDEDGAIRVLYTATDQNGEDYELETLVFTISANLQFDYLEGYLGEEVFDSTPGEIVIDFFDDFIRGDVYFEDPTITMTITNSFGIPVNTKAEYFEVVTIENDTLPLESTEIGEDLEISFNYPELDEVGVAKTTVYTFNNQNSNIAEILGSGPALIRYDVDAVPNPNQNTDIRGFISCESEYFVDIKAELPIFGRADNFGATDTFDLDFSGYDAVKSAEFKIVTENELPLDMTMQIYFATEDGQVTDSLFNEPTTLIASPETDADGISIGVSKEEFFSTLDADRFRRIADEARKIVTFTSFSTTDNGTVPVKVLADQEVQLRMGMKLVRE